MNFFRTSVAALLISFGPTSFAAPIEIYDGNAVPTAQGWTKANIGGTETVGAGVTQFSTSTPPGALSGEMQSYRLPVSSANFIASIRLRAISVAAHNVRDAALMFTVVDTYQAPFGSPVNRDSMLYIESARMGWADDTASVVIDSSVYHDYVVRYLNGAISVFLDVPYADIVAGTATPLLTKVLATSNTSSAVIVFGDQTNDANVDSTYQVDYVRYQNLNVVPGAGSTQSIPTLSEWGVIIMSAALALFGVAMVRRRPR